jgi:type II secretory pathway predicted ATPase ExeA
MTPLHLTHFGLTRTPFSKEIADSDLWLPPSKGPLVDDIEDAVRARSSILLVGDPGVGKTCVLRALRHRLGQADFQLTYCHNATLGRRDFYRQICVALGLSPRATAASVFYAISTHVQELAQEKAHPVFLLDEAHLLHQDTLDHLHILLNYEWDSRALLTLVLVGLPDLADRLQLRRNRSLLSRLSVRRRVAPLSPEDTWDYLLFRAKNAGATREIFTRDAAAFLHEAAGGTLRDLDRIAAAALHEASVHNRERVERDIVQRVLAIDAQHRQL